jgi:hypothetical protein
VAELQGDWCSESPYENTKEPAERLKIVRKAAVYLAGSLKQGTLAPCAHAFHKELQKALQRMNARHKGKDLNRADFLASF